MVKLLKKLAGPLISLFFLLNMTSTGYAETTVSAEVGFIFNTFPVSYTHLTLPTTPYV